MLDLTKTANKYELKWFDGQVLHLEVISQKLLYKMMEIDDIEDEKEQFDLIISILGDVLNSNMEKRTFTEEELRSIPLDVIQLILTDYANSIYERLGE